MKLGVCYYPEQWPVSQWEVDARQMRKAGISVVRVGEFSWSWIEPRPGVFRWNNLDRTVQTLAAEGLGVVLCTPTAAPPAWLIKEHPDILPVDKEGRRRRFGSRRHYCPNHPRYRQHSEEIAANLGERYGQHPAVIGWQIDNEFGCYFARCYCPICAVSFREWLMANYRDLNALNQAWGTNFWSQTYTEWAQIEPPNLTVAEPNPSHVLDYYRFASQSWVDYQGVQVDALREVISSEQWVTHNLIGSLTAIDYHDLARKLDFISWDSYPTGYEEIHRDELYGPEAPPQFSYDLGDPVITGFFHALVRGLKQEPFWVMEQQTGNINWSAYNTGVRPGALRLWTWQALASGAEAVVYFRWRGSRSGPEQHHAGLRCHDGSPDVGYRDLLEMGQERDWMERITWEPLSSPVGILIRYEDLWALSMQPHRKGFSLLKLSFLYYRAGKRLGLDIDLVSPRADLNKYRILIAPCLHLGSPRIAEHLRNFTARGGTLLLGIRSGFKDATNLVTSWELPGDYRELAGAVVSSWHSLPPGVSYPLETNIPDLQGPAVRWMETLSPGKGTESLVRYAEGPFQGQSALTRHPIEAGRVYYLGFYPDLEQAQTLVAYLAREANVEMHPSLPEGLFMRTCGSTVLVFNFTDQSLTAHLPSSVEIKPRQVKMVPRSQDDNGGF